MRTLYLDTTSSYLFAGICDNQKKVYEVQLKLDKELSSFTLYEIEKMFQTCQLTPNDIDKIIVVNGPGSFTGIRIGVTIAKIYAWTLKKDITTISSLEAMATSCNEIADYIVPIIDARRESVYTGIFTREGISVLKEQYMKQEELIEEVLKLKGRVIVVTNDSIETNYIQLPYLADIEKIVKRYENKKSINPHAIEPEYLKRTEAEENKK